MPEAVSSEEFIANTRSTTAPGHEETITKTLTVNNVHGKILGGGEGPYADRKSEYNYKRGWTHWERHSDGVYAYTERERPAVVAKVEIIFRSDIPSLSLSLYTYITTTAVHVNRSRVVHNVYGVYIQVHFKVHKSLVLPQEILFFINIVLALLNFDSQIVEILIYHFFFLIPIILGLVNWRYGTHKCLL